LTLQLDDKEPFPFMPLDISIHSEEILDEVLGDENAEIFDGENTAELALHRVPSRVYRTRDVESVRDAPRSPVDE
jgi:hypothetical protein